jgi:hypothetical protein
MIGGFTLRGNVGGLSQADGAARGWEEDPGGDDGEAAVRGSEGGGGGGGGWEGEAAAAVEVGGEGGWGVAVWLAMMGGWARVCAWRGRGGRWRAGFLGEYRWRICIGAGGKFGLDGTYKHTLPLACSTRLRRR